MSDTPPQKMKSFVQYHLDIQRQINALQMGFKHDCFGERLMSASTFPDAVQDPLKEGAMLRKLLIESAPDLDSLLGIEGVEKDS